jgi:hypothetical protein
MPRDQAEKTLEARFRVSGLMESTDRAIDAAESRGSRFRLGAPAPRTVPGARSVLGVGAARACHPAITLRKPPEARFRVSGLVGEARPRRTILRLCPSRARQAIASSPGGSAASGTLRLRSRCSGLQSRFQFVAARPRARRAKRWRRNQRIPDAVCRSEASWGTKVRFAAQRWVAPNSRRRCGNVYVSC